MKEVRFEDLKRKVDNLRHEIEQCDQLLLTAHEVIKKEEELAIAEQELEELSDYINYCRKKEDNERKSKDLPL